MNTEEVLDNWSDIESGDSDVSSGESEDAREESSDDEDDVDSQTWREATGTGIYVCMQKCINKNQYSTIDYHRIYVTIDALPRPPTSFTFSASPGVNIGLPRSATPIEYLQLFLTTSVLQYIIDNTNEYARADLSAIPPSQRSLFRNWKDVIVREMRAFIGVILQMGLVQLSDIKDYWSTHSTLNFPFFRSIFSRDRFLQIFWMLHVGEMPSTTRRSKIQPFLELFIPLFQQCLTPNREIAIDEAMIAFRGRIVFSQYIRGKPEPWGIKAYVLSESRTGYMYNLVIYYSRETQLICTEHNHTTNVVLSLVNPLVGLGYDLYTDRFYTSPLLATELLKVNTTLTGTVMCNRKEMPAAAKGKKQRKGDVDTYAKGQMVVVQWTDKRTITTLCTKHTNAIVSIPSRLVCQLLHAHMS